MPIPIPTQDGDVNAYNPANASIAIPRIYFVNGIQVSARDHALAAAYLSLLVERPVWGVYNATAGPKLGMLGDLSQCVKDYLQNATARLGSRSNLGKAPQVSDAEIPAFLDDLERRYTIWNKATPALFRELVRNRHQPQFIIAHSQGNLITSNALFVLEDVLGSAGLQKVRVYSLASPAPAWPLGLRKVNGGGGRQDNAFMNDLVALLRPHNLASKLGVRGFQNAGDFRTHATSGPVSLGPHAMNVNIETLNFLKSIRGDLGLPRDLPPDFLARCAQVAQGALN